MAVNLYKGFTNDKTGESFRCISFEEDAIRFQWTVKPGGYVPFEHIHLHQDETFHVKKGELKILIEGDMYTIGEGQYLKVSKGRRHIAFNNSTTTLECDVEYSPGLDSYQFFQCFAGLIIDGDTSANGTVNIPKMLYFTKKMKSKCISRPTSIPAPVFCMAVNLFYLIGVICGWNKLFNKYTNSKMQHRPNRMRIKTLNDV